MDNKDRASEIGELVAMTFAVISKFLGSLFPPIRVSYPGDGYTGMDGVAELLRAKELLEDMPGMSPMARKLLDRMVLDWVVAVTNGASNHFNPMPWKLDIATYAINRILAQAELLAEVLGIVLEDNLFGDDEDAL